jgi:hypothetical protein
MGLFSRANRTTLVRFELSICTFLQNTLRPGYIKRCQFVVKVNILSSDLIGGYLTLDLYQPVKWAYFRLDALLADTMLTKVHSKIKKPPPVALGW